MKDKIILLRNQGKSYNEIVKILGCSKSLVKYYSGNNEKYKYLMRQRKYRKRNPLNIKLSRFLEPKKQYRQYNLETNSNKIIKLKTNTFNRRSKTKKYLKGDDVSDITVEQVQEKIGSNPKCYLTGRPIDINNSRSYNFDHIIPSSKGGKNTLDNLDICIKEANHAKNNLYLEEFFKLCEDVLKNQGYTIIKPTVDI